jgi:hypothetical protein
MDGRVSARTMVQIVLVSLTPPVVLEFDAYDYIQF